MTIASRPDRNLDGQDGHEDERQALCDETETACSFHPGSVRRLPNIREHAGAYPRRAALRTPAKMSPP